MSLFKDIQSAVEVMAGLTLRTHILQLMMAHPFETYSVEDIAECIFNHVGINPEKVSDRILKNFRQRLYHSLNSMAEARLIIKVKEINSFKKTIYKYQYVPANYGEEDHGESGSDSVQSGESSP